MHGALLEYCCYVLSNILQKSRGRDPVQGRIYFSPLFDDSVIPVAIWRLSHASAERILALQAPLGANLLSNFNGTDAVIFPKIWPLIFGVILINTAKKQSRGSLIAEQNRFCRVHIPNNYHFVHRRTFLVGGYKSLR